MKSICAVATLLFVFTSINAQEPEPPATQKYFTDTVLINQNGEKMRLYSDLIKGKTVIINSFFATCQGSCLPMSRNLEKGLRPFVSDETGGLNFGRCRSKIKSLKPQTQNYGPETLLIDGRRAFHLSSDRVLRFEEPQSWHRAAPGSRVCCLQRKRGISPLLWSLEAELAPTDAQQLIKSLTVFAAQGS